MLGALQQQTRVAGVTPPAGVTVDTLVMEGYGQPSIAPLANKVVCSNFSQFKAACETANTRVCIDPTLPVNTIWDFQFAVFVAAGTTVDMTAPAGFALQVNTTASAVTSFVCDFGNNLFFNANLITGAGANQSAGIWFRSASQYAMRHCHIDGVSDDAVGFGDVNSADVSGLSILDCKFTNNDKAFLLDGQRPHQTNVRQVSIGRCHVTGSRDRTPNCAGVQEVQLYNNLIENNDFGPYAQVVVAGGKSGSMLAESNVLRNNTNNNLRAWVLQAGIEADSYINTDDAEGGGFGNQYIGLAPQNTDRPVPGTVPMSPSVAGKMPTSQVEGYVLANAGLV